MGGKVFNMKKGDAFAIPGKDINGVIKLGLGCAAKRHYRSTAVAGGSWCRKQAAGISEPRTAAPPADT